VVVPLPGVAVSAARAFVFGKLPRHGDFVARGLTAEARAAWDAWLSGVIERSRQDLGDAFEAAHEAAPAWRFMRAPGVLGVAGQAGALAPSIDAAGRRFFIVVGGEGASAVHGEAIAEEMESLIYRALLDNLDADTLTGAAQTVLDKTPDEDAPADPPRELWWTAEARHDRPPARLIESAPLGVQA
jgi:type VI secretion system protein ImpM